MNCGRFVLTNQYNIGTQYVLIFANTKSRILTSMYINIFILYLYLYDFTFEYAIHMQLHLCMNFFPWIFATLGLLWLRWQYIIRFLATCVFKNLYFLYECQISLRPS